MDPDLIPNSDIILNPDANLGLAPGNLHGNQATLRKTR